MHKLHTHQVGLSVGAFVGLLHLILVLAVGFGVAQRAVTFALGMHFLSVPFTILPFSWRGGLLLIVLASIAGYILGSVFALICNKVSR